MYPIQYWYNIYIIYSVSNALDEAALALNRMRSKQAGNEDTNSQHSEQVSSQALYMYTCNIVHVIWMMFV